VQMCPIVTLPESVQRWRRARVLRRQGGPRTRRLSIP